MWPAKAVFDAQVGEELIKLMLAGGVASAQAKQAVGEFLAIVYKYGPNPYWVGPFQIAQDPAGIGDGL